MKVLVTGATGFVGHEVVAALRRGGHAVTALVREPARAADLAEAGVRLVTGDVLEPSTLERAVVGQDAVVHLVGVIVEPKSLTFDDLHRQATENVLAAAKAGGVPRYLHMSANGTRPDAASPYHTTKWAAEEAVRASGLQWTIFRPSLIFGGSRRDKLFRTLAGFYRKPFFVPVPLVGSGSALMQPVAVTDVARAFAEALGDPKTHGKTYVVVGRERMSFREMVAAVGAGMGKKRWMAPGPPPLLRFFAWAFLERLRNPPLTRAQITMALEDNVGDPTEVERDFAMRMRAFRESIPAVLASLDSPSVAFPPS
jgi:NADH dehydrogenase